MNHVAAADTQPARRPASMAGPRAVLLLAAAAACCLLRAALPQPAGTAPG